jgi:hypothetical protein
MILIVMAAVWKQISYNFLFFLAGLQSIPKSLIEAAAIDGAGPWRRFWTIVSSRCCRRPPSSCWSSTSSTSSSTPSPSSTQPPRAGRARTPRSWSTRSTYDGFKAMDLGGSAAQSVVLMVIVVALTVVQFRYVESGSTTDVEPYAQAAPPGGAMVERRPWPTDLLAHLTVLVLGVLIVAFPGLPDLRRQHAHRRGHRAGADAAAAGRPVLGELRSRCWAAGAPGTAARRRWRR